MTSPGARHLVALLALLPWALAACLTDLGATRAFLLAWVVEAGVPGPVGPRAVPAFFLRHGVLWLLLHLLGPDGPTWVGFGLLALATATLPWWGCGAWRGGRRLRPALVLALFAPALAAFVLLLAGRRPPAWLARVDPWRLAGPAPIRTAPPRPDLPPSLPGDARLASLDYRLPPRLWPRPLEAGPRKARALLLLALTLAGEGAVLLVRGRGRRLLQILVLTGPLLAWPLARDPQGVRLHWYDGAGPGLLLEVHRAGTGLWDPLRGPLLPGPGPLVVRPEGKGGLLRVVAAGPWAVVRSGAARIPEPGEEAAWLVHRLPGPVAAGGPPEALAILRLWVAGEPGTAGGVRWSLAADGRTLWRRPPEP